ncbi:LysE family translocator [Pseudoalteromonas sp. T1lg65]|uniref:LysE family translocator n=1 Tax=Pseudoalteromonas sp. T1lg65 TaxID=2077101 RepID=UPI003F78C0B9
MIDITILPVFFIATFFLVISPGPDLLLISTYSSSRGFKAGLMIALGIFVAGVIQTLLVAFGLGQLMQAMPLLVWLIKIVGALYLVWLGLGLLKAWLSKQPLETSNMKAVAISSHQLVYQGLFNNLMNPKALLFFSMFLPQFTHADLALTPQILILGLLLSGFALAINVVFALSFSKLGSVVGGKFRLGKHTDGLLGIIFLGLATRLAVSD